MITLTKSVFDVADCNITPHYLASGAKDDPLPFSSAAAYNGFYQRIAREKPDYEDVGGHAGAVLESLRGAYSPNEFWRWFLESLDEETYPQSAWQSMVPVAAVLTSWVDVVLPAGMDLQVRPEPLVLLHPFGWATWINFLIVGDHSLDDLAALTTHLLEEPAYQLDGKKDTTLTLDQLLDRVGKGVRQDAYGGGVAFRSPKILSVTTVLGKHGGSPSLGALTDEQSSALKRIVRSEGVAPASSLGVPLKKGEDELLDFVLHDGMSWFLWAEHRLRPFGRNAKKLRCYHNNTVRSLVHAWLLHQFLAQAVKIKPWSDTLNDLVERALNALAAPTYKNFSMMSFLERKDFQAARAAAEKRLGP